MPRGLSMPTTGTPVASSSDASAERCGRVMLAGPVSTSGRLARTSRAMNAAASVADSVGDVGLTTASLALETAPEAACSKASVGRLTCTGPGRPDNANAMALVMSLAKLSAPSLVQECLVTGAAKSACRIS